MRTRFRAWWLASMTYDTAPTQVALILALIGWGCVFILPTDSFGLSPSYALLGRHCSESFWSLYCLAVGITWGVAFVRRPRSIAVRWCAFASTLFWAMLSAGAFLAVPITFSWIAFAIFGGQSAWVFMRRNGAR